MVKPSGLGSSVGMTLVHDLAELPAALDLAFRYDTHALVETYLAGARDLEVAILGNDALELYGPGEIVSGHEFYDYAAKYTPGPVRDLHRGRGQPRPEGADPQARARHVPGDRLRGLRPRRLPGRRRADRRLRDQHDPGLHPDQPLPDDAVRRGLRVRGRLRAGRRARPGPRRRARSPAASPERTCRDEPPSADPPPDTAGAGPPDTPRPARVVGAAHADPGRRRARHARQPRRALRRVVVERLRLRARPAHVGPRLDGPRGGRGRHRRRPRPEPVPHLDRSARGGAGAAPDRRARPHRRRVPRHAGRDARRAHPDPDLEGRRPAVPRRRRRQAVRRAAGRAQRGDGRPAGRGRRAVRLGRPDRGQHPRPGRPRRRHAAGLAGPRGRRQLGDGAVDRPHRRERLPRPLRAARLDRGLRHLHPDDPHPGPHPGAGPPAAQPARGARGHAWSG